MFVVLLQCNKQKQTVMTQTVTELSLDSAKVLAPAIFATEPASYINLKRYNFVPTTEIIEQMNSNGWLLTDARQSKSKNSMRNSHGTHVVKFQNPEMYIKDSNGGIEGRPTVVFFNSHDGTRPLQVELGIFRLVCSNGLVIKTQDLGGFRERHTRFTNDEIKSMLAEKTSLAALAVEKINAWSGIQMSPSDMRRFAADAILLRLREERSPEEHEVLGILEPKREADRVNNLWNVMNRIQENLIRGGFTLGERSARAITNPIVDLSLNQGLWQMAEDWEKKLG